jgi:hypothetical protein
MIEAGQVCVLARVSFAPGAECTAKHSQSNPKGCRLCHYSGLKRGRPATFLVLVRTERGYGAVLHGVCLHLMCALCVLSLVDVT